MVCLEGGLEGGLQRGLQTGLGRGLAVNLRSVKVHFQVRSGPGLVQYIELKFNSFELDSEVERLVLLADKEAPAEQLHGVARVTAKPHSHTLHPHPDH